MTRQEPVQILANWIEEDVALLRELLACPPAHFHEYTITTNGKRRLVAEPDGALKRVQRRIVRRVLRLIPAHDACFCRSGRSIIDNARRHLKNRHVYTFDVADAFPSTTHRLVESSLRRALATHRIPISIVKPITQLCTLHGALPQGAPTSSALLDVVLRPVDEMLQGISQRHGARYSRYVDDITLSAGCRMPWAEREVVSALERVGLRLRHAKTKKWAPPRRATVTGIVLRERLELPRDYVSPVKSLVRDITTSHLLPDPEEVQRLRGAIGHIRRLHPHIGRRLAEELRAFQA